ncbi:PhnD/SsuA/transferrin family substrate-binding protein [Aerococcus sp. UMB7834]|uniref:phosphate/phosphite/phosphonate ABC transporter substrate-binding protein n=1 Tax=Aerococcus sp. UMB7834 TaxID=3046342 RepID=UPI00254B7780|nr:PhnD/SsuA/transferrin family substrate-binding protein [Aerococcus sp. UMB7834]MDK6804669.1 PhnD/SsuA/transferrin family substrate-binding protein [Aerococcus sp. UMB7834]
MTKTLKVGAVIYDPKITVIWDMIRQFIEDKNQGILIEPVFYDDYRHQIDDLVKKEIDVAWNSPLANREAELRTDGKVKYGLMRDTDRDLHTVLVTKKGSGIESVADLKGKKVAFGAIDSPQARLIPIQYLRENGLEFGQDYEEVRYDIGVGLDGDHTGGELDAIKSVEAGENIAGFAIAPNFEAWVKDGTVDGSQLEVVGQTPSFDHCIFTAHEEVADEDLQAFSDVLATMDYSKERDKEILDLEGLKEWLPGRTSNFEEIRQAVDYMNFFDK